MALAQQWWRLVVATTATSDAASDGGGGINRCVSLSQRRCFIMAAPKLCRHKGQHGRTMASGGKWRQAGSMAVAAGGRDNGNQGRGRDLVEKLDYPFGAFFFAQKLDLA